MPDYRFIASETSSVTSNPTLAGRQCMKTLLSEVFDMSLESTINGFNKETFVGYPHHSLIKKHQS